MSTKKLQLPSIPDLSDELLRLLPQIPRGRVTTYGSLADALGDKVASRWVGLYLLNHQHRPGVECACHRVVRATGELGGYVDDVRQKKQRLRAEGVEVRDNCVPLQAYLFNDFESKRPLTSLRTFQNELNKALRIEAPATEIRLISGVDVSYGAGDQAVGVCTLHDAATADLIWSTTLVRRATFPYISTYLAFRELPLLVELLSAAEAADQRADVVVVDGSGIMHPRKSGIATMLGIVCNQPTIGVTKKRLHGRFDSEDLKPLHATWVWDNQSRIGAATLPPTGTKKPIFVSPGHAMDVDSSVALVLSQWKLRRLPEPIYWADRLSRTRVKELDRSSRLEPTD